nr:unnamed protein product [Callosobruchus analis]
MSGRPLTDKELEELANQISSDSEADDDIEVENVWDSDDSIADPDFIPDDNDVEEAFENELMNVWNETNATQTSRNETLTPKLGQAGLAAPCISGHVTPNEVAPDCVLVPETDSLLGKNGYVWTTKPKKEGKTPSINVVHVRPGPVPAVKGLVQPASNFQLFFPDGLLEKVVLHTNQEINRQNKKYKVTSQTVSETNLVELKSLLGLYILAAGLKDNHLSSNIMFDSSLSGTRYKSTMSKGRFEFLTSCLRFDDKTTRNERRAQTVFAPISEIWDEFIEACRKSYKPGSYVTIDEQLVGFRGRCPFRMYIPNKPSKYGIKIVLLCDVSTKYLIHASPYLGKSTKTNGKPLADYYVEQLTASIQGSNRNVTMDNWFTSVPLVDRFAEKPFNLSIVGTIRKNKPQLPSQITENKKERQVGTSMFAYTNKSTVVSYKPKKNKIVNLISSMHNTVGSIKDDTKKPFIIETYNSTKGAVDTFDQMCQNMCANRKTRRWPLCLFFNMINMACINSYVIYSHNVSLQGGKPLSRQAYMMELHKELCSPQQIYRLQNTPNMSRSLKRNIAEVLKQEEPTEHTIEQNQKGKRTYCSTCPSAKKRMTVTYCPRCKKPICGEHQVKICQLCL